MTTQNLWFVLDMDEGVRGVYKTRQAALQEHLGSDHYTRHKYGPGAYEYSWWYPGDRSDGDSFFLEQLSSASKGGWDWAIRAWREAGCPLGRFDQPLGRSDDEQID
jgi:hypothetical protein